MEISSLHMLAVGPACSRARAMNGIPPSFPAASSAVSNLADSAPCRDQTASLANSASTRHICRSSDSVFVPALKSLLFVARNSRKLHLPQTVRARTQAAS